jgi:predicted nucleic acid-binding Zn finger protein
MTFLVNIEYQNFTRIHIEKIILQVLLLFQDSKWQIVHSTEGHNAVYGPVGHQKKYYMDQSFCICGILYVRLNGIDAINTIIK